MEVKQNNSYRREGMPLKQRLCGDFQTVEWRQLAILEMEANSVIRETLRINVVMAKTAPRKNRAASGDEECPKVGRRDQVHSKGLWILIKQTVLVSSKDCMNPKCDESNPARVTMHCLKVVVVHSAEGGMGTCQDEGEHGQNNV